MSIERADLEAAYARLERPLHNVLYRWLWDAGECQDLLHDAFMRVWDARARVDAARIDALIYTTALNLARNKLRWRGLWRWFAPDPDAADDGENPEQFATRACRERRLRDALDQLSHEHRDVVLLSECAGMNTTEIATVLAIPAGTVASRKHVAMARLRVLLGDDDDL